MKIKNIHFCLIVLSNLLKILLKLIKIFLLTNINIRIKISLYLRIKITQKIIIQIIIIPSFLSFSILINKLFFSIIIVSISFFNNSF